MILTDYSTKIQSVTELSRSIRGLLETEFPFVSVRGEISNLKKPYSGHIYCTLKDQGAQIRTVLFKSQQRWLSFTPEEGIGVICRGRLSVYEPRGEYQIIVDTLEKEGAGQLQIAFEELKKKLEAEGLFSATRKKELPFFPEKISLITSPHGAALYDFLRLARQRFPGASIDIFPVKVQGDGAAREIITALELLNKRAVNNKDAADQVIVLCRGGGSIEDLWTFNEEKLARAITASAIPVISAVGHEIDFTIADFAADHRSATPTAAAREILPNRSVLKQDLLKLKKRSTTAVIRKIETLRQHLLFQRRRLGDPLSLLSHFSLRLDNLHSKLNTGIKTFINYKRYRYHGVLSRFKGQKPDVQIARQKMELRAKTERLTIFMQRQLENKINRLACTASRLESVSPLAVLERGYAIVRKLPGREVINDSRQIKKGDRIEIKLHKGLIKGRLTGITKYNENQGTDTKEQLK
ncbi:MAG: exodeoxyribonuclease VII large subunit [Thermodesulfobacteriota bacterium]